MFLGRTEELATLHKMYDCGSNSLTVVYGRTGIGKTELVKEFIKDKPGVYYVASQASAKQQLELMYDAFASQLGNVEYTSHMDDIDYRDVFAMVSHKEAPVKVIVIEEFHNIVKQNKNFMSSLKKLVEGKGNIMVICTCSSIGWIENGLVSAIGSDALSINCLIKLKEFTYMDVKRFYKGYDIEDVMTLYAVTGGVPGYMVEFSDTFSIKENICNSILAKGKRMRGEGAEYIKEELRETAVYNTILSYIAKGYYKLNELHALTGFGRDKISVYLKNLMEREIVEKLYSYDADGNEYTRKGLYRIKSGFTEFWYKYIYGREYQLELLQSEDFYDIYIADTISDFPKETFIKAGMEYVQYLDCHNQLPVKIDRRGRWWGKNGDIDIIACDIDKKYVVGSCNWQKDVFTFTMFEELVYNVNLAGIGRDYIYLFSKGTFDEELTAYAKDNDNIKLIGLIDM